MDFTLVSHPSGEIIAHAVDCPSVQQAREKGWPLATLVGAGKLPPFMPIAICLKDWQAGDGEPARAPNGPLP
jgi:hypothetical protein